MARIGVRTRSDEAEGSLTGGPVRRLLPGVLSVAYLLTLAYLARFHPFGTYATETDFYHLFAPDAERLAAGRFPENPYQGPGYPAALALVGGIAGDLFTAGKWISIVAAALVAYLAFVLFARLFGYWTGVGAALLVMVSGEFPQFGINATSDAFFLLLCAVALVLLAGKRPAARPRAALLGAVTGYAFLTRTNGLFLVPVCILGILWLDTFESRRGERIRLVALFAAVCLLVMSPWMYANWRHHGNPFYNANYLNIATEFYPELSEGRTNQDGTRRLEETFHSFGDVVRFAPGRMLAHYPVNVLESVRLSAGTLVSPWVGCLALAGAALVAFERRSRTALLLVIAGGLYFLLLGFIHWESRYYFFIMFLYAGFAIAAAVRLLDLARSRGLLRHRAFDLLPVALWLVMFGTSLAYSRGSFARFLASHPTEVLDACEYLKGAHVTGARILSRKPHLPYLCRQEWVFFPPAQSLSDFEQWLRRNPVDYVTFSSIELARRPGLAVLRDPKRAPAWLEAVWTNPGKALFVLYRPRLD